MNKDRTERLEGTAAMPPNERDRLIDVDRAVRMPGGSQIFGPSRVPDSLFFLYDGRIWA